MLPLFGCGGPDGRRRSAQLDCLVYNFETTHPGMIDRGCHFQVLYLRIGEHLVHRVDRAARAARPVQHVDPVRARISRGYLGYCGVHLGPVFRPPGARSEPLVGYQVFESDGLAEPFVHHPTGHRNVDMAIGCDQGGSIRIPSAFCGTYGMKPTHGLVPYTGIMPIEATIDHAGPITANVRDNALMLEVIAGADGLDPRQYSPKVESYTDALDKGVRGLKIGVLTEGFQLPNMDPQVAAKVRAAVTRLQELGATVEEISVPEHQLAGALWSPIGCEGLTVQMMHGNGMGFNWEGLYDVGLLDKHAAWREQADVLSPSLKVCMFVGQYGLERYSGRYYAKAQNLARRARAGYDRALAEFDLLVMPTLPIVAQPLPESNCSITDYITRAFEMIGNTAPQDITGNPAMSVPCGLVDGLPVGMMLVGRHYAESTIYQAAAAFEASGDWRLF